MPVPASNIQSSLPSVARYALRMPSERPSKTRLPAVASTPPPSATGSLAVHAAFSATGSQATSAPTVGGELPSFALRGPS